VLAENNDGASHQTSLSRVSTRELGCDLGRIAFEERQHDAAAVLNK
jgi:hypothetical protein